MTPATRHRTVHAGQTIAHYRIIGPVAAGGTGGLYRAEDLRGHRTVALRILPRVVAQDEETREEYLRVVRAASELDHPNLCAVTDVADDGDGGLVVAMQCYDGESVREKMSRGPISVETSIAIARQLAEGLGMAHDNGLIHGHLTPDSVMVTGDGVVKILDFGLPHVRRRRAGHESDRDGGLPDYRAPELMRGADADERADIWAFGLMLYEMLTGVMPFRGDHLLNRMATIIGDDLREAADLRPEIPGSLSHLCKRCLTYDPRRRPQNMNEVQSLLGHWPFEIGAAGQPGWNRVRGWYVAIAVGIVVVLTGLLVWFLTR